jgi:hypothetical protein
MAALAEPLAVLEDPCNLARLVAVLDRIATESHTAVPVVEVSPDPAGATATSIQHAGATAIGG